MQGKVKKVKPSARNVVEKYKEVLDQSLKELNEPEEVREGLETFIAAGRGTRYLGLPVPAPL